MHTLTRSWSHHFFTSFTLHLNKAYWFGLSQFFYSIIWTNAKLFLKWKYLRRFHRKWFLIVWRWDICSKLPKMAQKMEKLLNQFKNFYYLTTQSHLKTQYLIETCNRTKYLKCGTKSYKKSIRDWKLLNQFNNFCQTNNWSELVGCYLKSILKLLKIHVNWGKFTQESQELKSY